VAGQEWLAWLGMAGVPGGRLTWMATLLGLASLGCRLGLRFAGDDYAQDWQLPERPAGSPERRPGARAG
jgi:hypothetical protein